MARLLRVNKLLSVKVIYCDSVLVQRAAGSETGHSGQY